MTKAFAHRGEGSKAIDGPGEEFGQAVMAGFRRDSSSWDVRDSAVSHRQALDPELRQSFEHRFGEDFTRVRLLIDSSAAESVAQRGVGADGKILSESELDGVRQEPQLIARLARWTIAATISTSGAIWADRRQR